MLPVTTKQKSKPKREKPTPEPSQNGSGDVKVKKHKIDEKAYEKELARLQIELVKMQEWVKHEGLKVAVVFEGRDAAGKGGVIKRITQSLNPRIRRVAALGRPTERVMGFCSDQEYNEFLRSCPEFERMLIRSGVILIKYWFSVSDEEQERRFQKRMHDVTRSWKLSPMDVESRSRWMEYSKAKDEMFAHTDIKQSPWQVVKADSKKCARLNCISHLLSMIPYKDLTPSAPQLLPRPEAGAYLRPPIEDQTFIPELW